jgi:hypothetical protein
MLRHADLANTGELLLDPDEEALVVAFDFGHPGDRELIAANLSGAGLASAGHTLDAYRRLPHGWRVTPEGTHTDTHMWRQFLEQPWCKVASSARPTVVKLASDVWKHESPQRRLEMLGRWVRRITAPGGETGIAWSLCETAWGASPHPDSASRHARIPVEAGFTRYELGAKLEFSQAATRARYLSWGWSAGEHWGVWSDGEEARITLSLKNPVQRRLRLEANLSAFGSSLQLSRPVDVMVNGSLVARWCVEVNRGDRSRWAEFPAAERIDLRFLIPFAAAARQIVRTPDHRRLGIALRDLAVRQAE